MSERSQRTSKLKIDRRSRESYTYAKLGVLVPSQIKALRLTSRTPKQTELAKAAGGHQSRLSMLEQPGVANITLETLAWIASIHKVGVIVQFVSFSEMLAWENSYSAEGFNVTRLDDDIAFLSPETLVPLSTAVANSDWVKSPVKWPGRELKPGNLVRTRYDVEELMGAPIQTTDIGKVLNG